MKIMFNCIHIWSVDLFFVMDKVLGRNLIRKQYFETLHWSNLFLSGALDPNNMVPGTNHMRPVGLFLIVILEKNICFGKYFIEGPQPGEPEVS